MAEPIDMLELAKKLVPDIETGMPEDVAKAFSEGRIKTIFRTAESIPLTELSSGSESRLSGVVNPGSTYFLDEEGKIARYGRNGLGWEDARTAGSAGKDAGKSSFIDRAIFGKHSLQELDIESGKSPSEAVDDFLKQGGFTEPTLGGTLTEFDNDFSRKHKGHAVSDIYHSTGEVEFVDQLTEGESIGGKVRPKVVKANIENISIEKNLKSNITPRLKPGSAPAPVAPTPTSPAPQPPASNLRGTALNPTPAAQPPASNLRGTALNPTPAPQPPASNLRGTAVPNSAPKPGSITMQSAGVSKIGHINSPKYGLKVPDMNINHGWKIHGDLVADLTREEAFAKIGLETTDIGAKIVDQKAYDAFNSRLSKIGIDPANVPNANVDFAESFLISRRIEQVGSHSTQMVNGRPMTNLPQYNRFYSDPLDTLSMMEVFHENQTQYKASAKYGDGRSFTGYTQSIENRDKLISSLESRLGDRLQDINPTILGGHQTEGATQLSQKITGRFTTEYTDIPSAGGAMDWASQNPAASKGQAAIDNVMATNPQMRPYIHTGVIDDQSAANLKKLTDDFPVFNEMLHGPNGYVSPYATIEDTFSQQGYDYKTGKALAPSTATAPPVTPVTPPPTPPQSAVITETYDHGAEVSKATASGEVLVESPPPKTTTPPPTSSKPEKQGIRVGSSSKIKTTPDPHGSAPSTPPPPNGRPINTGRTNRSRYNKRTKSYTKHSTVFRRTI
jgi:hypothetical protein